MVRQCEVGQFAGQFLYWEAYRFIFGIASTVVYLFKLTSLTERDQWVSLILLTVKK